MATEKEEGNYTLKGGDKVEVRERRGMLVDGYLCSQRVENTWGQNLQVFLVKAVDVRGAWRLYRMGRSA